MSDFDQVTAANIKTVMEGRIGYYEEQSEILKSLIEREGVTIENLESRRRALVQDLAMDLAHDLSVVARVRIQCIGSPYYKPILDDFTWYLKDVRDSIKLYISVETRLF
jgi:hypothetical protein